jgi:hypothetical protein
MTIAATSWALWRAHIQRLLELERTDPVAAAGARGFAITPLDPSDPQTFIQGLMQRRAMAEAMVAQGFADPKTRASSPMRSATPLVK